MLLLNLDYKSLKTELCDIGAIYDTDSSSQRIYVTNERHCHPYTIFYDSLFKSRRDSELTIAEIGVGGSTCMWRKYFKNSSIYGFDINTEVIIPGVVMTQLNVEDPVSIKHAFSKVNQKYDFIIEDTTHWIHDQMNVVKNVFEYLKPGGVLILQSIYKNYDENLYCIALSDILEVEKLYFVSFTHDRMCSTGFDNDKILVLVKKGEPIFKQQNKLTLITPSIRPLNLLRIYNSINFDYVHEWVIVYDGSKISENPNIFRNLGNPKIREYIHTGDGISGNPQRNYALDILSSENPDTYLYYLDDDNIIDPRIYGLLDILDDSKMYTFGQECYTDILDDSKMYTFGQECFIDIRKGERIEICYVDSAMVLIDFKLCKDIRWQLDSYEADGKYIVDCYEKNKNNYIFVNNVLTVYNGLF